MSTTAPPGEGPATATAPRKSNRTSTATKKRGAADEGNPEQAKKKIKALEDRISELANTNDALSGAVRAMRKEQAAARHDANSERGNSDDDEDNGVDNNSPMLFKSRNIKVTSRLDPDAARLGKGKHATKGLSQVESQLRREVIETPPNTSAQRASVLTQGDAIPAHHNAIPAHRDPIPAYRDPIPAHRDAVLTQHNTTSSPSPVPPGHVATPERVDSPAQLTPGFSSNNSTHPPTQLPPRPWPPAPLAPGTDPNAPKTANKAYDKAVAGMLADAQHAFECLLFTKDAYPDLNTQVQWSYGCWEAVCKSSNTYYELSRDMLNLIKARCSHGRGAVLLRVRPVVDGLFNINTGSQTAVRKNDETARKLLRNNAFYYVRGTMGKRRFEDPTMLRAIQCAFFSGSRSCAAHHQLKFNPVPLESLALVCTVYEHCLHEWKSGTRVQANLDETIDSPRYRTHLENHRAWKGLDDQKTSLVLKHITRKLFDSCKSVSKQIETTGSVSLETLEQEKAELDGWILYSTEEEV